MPLSAKGEPITLVSQIDAATGLTAGLANPSAYTLLTAASATGPAVSGIRGGDYIWQIEGTFGGGTATLQRLGLDGSTWKNVRNAANTADVTATADSSIGVGVGQGATMRVLIAGATGASLNSSLAGLA